MELGPRHLIGGIVLVIGAAGYFAWQQQDRERAAAQVSHQKEDPVARDAASVVIYKWQDDAGTWNFTESPPPGITPYTEIKGTPNVTSVPTVVPESGPAISAGENVPSAAEVDTAKQ